MRSTLATAADLPARASHVVCALRRLLDGPGPAEGDLIAVTAILTAHLAETPAAAPRLHAVGGPPTWKLWHPGETPRGRSPRGPRRPSARRPT